MSTRLEITIIALALTLGACKGEAPPEPPKNAVAQLPSKAPEPQDEVELELPHQAEPYHGLVTSGQPTTEQFGKLKAAGYTTVVNLRAEDEPGYRDERDAATRDQMLYTHIPIKGPEDLTRENVQKLADTMNAKMAKEGKVLMHCGSGNRAGAMVALKAAWVDGRSAEDSLKLGKAAGLSEFEPQVKQLLEKKP